jgi:2-oxoglutarate dehydrogenase E2 component (dihydrolipoamide succinyltransferase)
MADVIMPQMGESIFEGTITKWLKKAGDKVERDEPLFEISTDKVDAEIPAPTAGVLREIKVGEGKTVPIQTVVAVIDAAGAAAGDGGGAAKPAPATKAPEKAPAQAAQPAAGAQKTASPVAAAGGPRAQAEPTTAKQAPPPQAPSPAATAQPTQRAAGSAPSPASKAPEGAATRGAVAAPQPAPAATAGSPRRDEAKEDGDRIYSSPLVRRLAREHNLDLSTLSGTGAGGRISKKDVLAAIEAQGSGDSADEARDGAEDGASAQTGAAAPAQPAAAPPMPQGQTAAARPVLETAVPRERIYFGRYEVQPMTAMRQRIAEHMVLSKRVSPHVYSIDEADVTHIARMRAAAKNEFEERHQTKLTFMAFFVRACVEALHDFPTVNASIDGSNVVLHGEINVGIAVALDWGLIVPVLKNAEEKSFLGLQRGINDLAERARTKKLKPEEVQESTFSITNPGTFGGLMGLPVINQPNVAILGIGTVQKRPVVVDDAIAIRSMVYLTLSYDHRVVDGAVAHQFMGQLKKRLEEWSEDVL